MARRIPISEQLRRGLRTYCVRTGKSRYRVSVETGIAKEVLSRFANRIRSMSLPHVDILCRYLGLNLNTKRTARKQPLSDQLRRAVRTAEKSQYRIAKDLDVSSSAVNQFSLGKRGMSLANVDKLGQSIGAWLVWESEPAKPKKRKAKRSQATRPKAKTGKKRSTKKRSTKKQATKRTAGKPKRK